MEIREMQMEDIECRLSEIKEEMNAPEANIEALTEEVNQIEARKAELKEHFEERKALEERVANGLVGEIIKDNEEFKEDIKMSEERTFAVDTAEYRTAWLKNLQGKELEVEERAAMSASSAIPTETMNQIVDRLELAPLLGAVDMTYIPGNVTYPVADSVADAGWVAMGTAATDSADSLTYISLSAYKLIKTVSINADVKAMSVSAFETWLVSKLANKIQKAVDKAILVGTGSGQATGILTTISGSGTYAKTGMTYKNLMTIIAGLKTEYLGNAAFIMPRATFYGEVLGMQDTTGGRVVVADAQAPAKFNILGYPVIVDDNCTADTVIFGDLKEYKFNFAKAPEVTSDNSVEFRTGDTCYRALALADGKVADQNAFVVFTKATA